MADNASTAHRLATDCRTLLDALDSLNGVRLTHVAFELHQVDDQRLLLSVQREDVVTDVPGEALTGFLVPWDPDADDWDYFHPIASFTSLGQLQTWLLDHYD
jgi:hypothetical protein